MFGCSIAARIRASCSNRRTRSGSCATFRWKDLQSQLTVELGVLGEEDHSHAAAPKLPHDRVGPDRLGTLGLHARGIHRNNPPALRRTAKVDSAVLIVLIMMLAAEWDQWIRETAPLILVPGWLVVRGSRDESAGVPRRRRCHRRGGDARFVNDTLPDFRDEV